LKKRKVLQQMAIYKRNENLQLMNRVDSIECARRRKKRIEIRNKLGSKLPGQNDNGDSHGGK
jgi:hypothetical protein